MPRDIWIISDTHLNHENILKFRRNDGSLLRDFKSINEMNEEILEKHNSVVKNGDLFYHLGDVFFGPREEFKGFWPKFNGSKRLIPGNHDDIKFLASGGFFQKIVIWRKMPEFGIIMTHVPVHNQQLGDKFINVHGHVHQNTLDSEQHINVSAEEVGYTPIHIEELRKR